MPAAPTISDVVVPLRTVDPDDRDDTDLQVLREVTGEARVVGLGESAHFTGEFTALRDRILRFLVRELGFSAFVIESGLPEGLAVDRWVRGGPGELAEIARHGISWSMGRCTEMHTQLGWMRDWNTTHPERQVGFYGMDVPGWLANPAPGVAACLDRLAPQPGDAALRAAADLGDPTGAHGWDASAAPAVPAGLYQQILRLVDRAETAGDRLAVQCARGALAVLEFLEHGLYPGPGRNLRNEVMAENLRWILDREQRVLVGGHNVHLQRSPSFDASAPIGALLAPELGADLVLVGTTRGSVAVPDRDLDAPPSERYFLPAGEPEPAPAGTLDASLATTGHPIALLDLHRTPTNALGNAAAMQGAFGLDVELDPHVAFDAVIHVDRITAAHGALDHDTGDGDQP